MVVGEVGRSDVAVGLSWTREVTYLKIGDESHNYSGSTMQIEEASCALRGSVYQ